MAWGGKGNVDDDEQFENKKSGGRRDSKFKTRKPQFPGRSQAENDENTEFQSRQRRNWAGRERRDSSGASRSDGGFENRISGDMGDSGNTQSHRYQTEVHDGRQFQSSLGRNKSWSGRGDDSDAAFSDDRFDRRKSSGMRDFRNTQPRWSERHEEMRNSVYMPSKWSQKLSREEMHKDSEFQQGRNKSFFVDLRECPSSMRPSDFYLLVTNAHRRFALNERIKATPEKKLEFAYKRYELIKQLKDSPEKRQGARRELDLMKPINNSPETKQGAPSTELELTEAKNNSLENKQDFSLERPPQKSIYHYRKKWSVQGDTLAKRGTSIGKIIKEAIRNKYEGLGLVNYQPNRKMRKCLGILSTDETSKRREDADDFAEACKNGNHRKQGVNARFRSIKPSPSIVSFVENNLLGRRRLLEFRRAGYNIDLKSYILDNVPYTKNLKRDPIEQTVFRNRMKLCASTKVATSFPSAVVPEIAFAGRSNVGKSSLLNSITRKWTHAETSDKPGQTQTIDFYDLGPSLRLVDLPGYGFAYAKDEVKEAWQELVKQYVSTRPNLRRVCLLVDTKWGLKPRDYEFMHLLDKFGTRYQIVLTKTDISFPEDVARRATQIEELIKDRTCAIHPLMMVSSKNGGGIRALRTVLSKIARIPKVLA